MDEKIKVVMIDDEEDLCIIVKANLEDSERFEVVTSSLAMEAEDIIRREKPDIVLLDVVMPQRKGPDIIASIKKDETIKDIPIIMISGKGEMVYNKKKDEFKWMPNSQVVKDRGELPDAKGAEALAEAYGVHDYISKPFTTELLLEVIDEVLAKTRKRSSEDKDESA